jgi:hypothetical protein
MRTFRRLQSPVLAVLLAFAMQATLLLAHAHVHPHAPSATQWGKSASIACRAIVPPEACRTGMPQRDHQDDCPLCWSLVASGAGVLPSSPLALASEIPLPLPAAPAISSPRVAARASQFQARAPPAA